MKAAAFYNHDYYERGVMLGISNYTDYRWLPHRSIPEAERLIDIAGLSKLSYVLDFGCAKGFLVKALFLSGLANVYGCDISAYAISNADRLISSHCKVSSRLNIIPFRHSTFDLITAVHVLEHIGPEILPSYLLEIRLRARKLFVRVPLGKSGWYPNPKHRMDISHVIAQDCRWWITLFTQCGFTVLHVQAHQYEKSLWEDEADFMLQPAY